MCSSFRYGSLGDYSLDGEFGSASEDLTYTYFDAPSGVAGSALAAPPADVPRSKSLPVPDSSGSLAIALSGASAVTSTGTSSRFDSVDEDFVDTMISGFSLELQIDESSLPPESPFPGLQLTPTQSLPSLYLSPSAMKGSSGPVADKHCSFRSNPPMFRLDDDNSESISDTSIFALISKT